MQKLWKIKPRNQKDLVQQLLENRGIKSARDQVEFLNPDYANLHDPFLFSEMGKAVQRILKAIANHEKILIYSDYDADAVTANAVVFRALRFLGASPETYIPDRFSEGYGLNPEAFLKIKAQNVKVVITADCGTNSIQEAADCRNYGIDLIITDHHELTGERPEAFALVNPKLPGEKYPYREITGVGLAFKLICALFAEARKMEMPQAKNIPEGFEKWFLDLVAIGTVADCHSLLGENRILVKYGLKVLAKTKWPGLRAILQLSGLDEKALRQELDTYTLGFIIAPRINAAGRIEHASIAFELLVSEDQTQALGIAQELERLNTRRQILTENVMSEARQQLELISERKVLLVSGSDWPKGVVGLVAGKLVEEYFRPVLVLERGAVESTGSGRSVSQFNLVDALQHAKEHLVRFGGHAAAAGFTLKTEHVEIFYKRLLDYAETNLPEEALTKVLEIEAELLPEEINLQNFAEIENFEPFGVGNIRPRFILRNAEIKEFGLVGKDHKHLQLTVQAGGKYFRCIGFNFGKAAAQLQGGSKIDLAFELLGDFWNGEKRLKLRMIDFRKATDEIIN